jgi:hypothetical protein
MITIRVQLPLVTGTTSFHMPSPAASSPKGHENGPVMILEDQVREPIISSGRNR